MHAAIASSSSSSQSFGRRAAAVVAAVAVGVTLFAGAWASSHDTDNSASFRYGQGRKLSFAPTDRRWVR
jgi:hypothetical protein